MCPRLEPHDPRHGVHFHCVKPVKPLSPLFLIVAVDSIIVPTV